MAIAFARQEFVKRSQNQNMVCKAAYIERSSLNFEGNTFRLAEIFNFTNIEKPIHNRIYLPEYVDKKFMDTEILWNAVEKFEKRKDSQVGYEFLLALPDDDAISIEDKIQLMEIFIQTQLTSKGYGVHAALHQPDIRNSKVSEINGLKEKRNHNWHCHLLVTPRSFNENGNNFCEKKTSDLNPSIRGAARFVTENSGWGKIWAQQQNDFFKEKGLNLRVDEEGVVSQNHLGPIRMRGNKVYAEIEKNEQNMEMNQKLSMDSAHVLIKLTETKSVFTANDVEAYFRKHVSESDRQEVRKHFWKNQDIVELFSSRDEHQGEQKFSTIFVINEEKKILRLADRIQANNASKYKINSFEKFNVDLNKEQKIAFEGIVLGKGLSCIEGHAGTGKSYLLVALKKFYENEGYVVRGFGPDNATVRVLEGKRFDKVTNIHKFLFKNYYSKENTFSNKEVWIVDESGKLGNKSLLEFLKQAEKSGAQVIFSGNSAQLSSVERGGMFKQFCLKYGHQTLIDIQRQHSTSQREISLNLARGNYNRAINLISSMGGFSWSRSKEGAILNLVETWMTDKSQHPFASQLIIAHSNQEVRAINELVHQYRKTCGEVSEKEFCCDTTFGKITVSEGDLIEFREKNFDMGVSNGSSAILVKATEKKFILKTQGEEKEREITFDPREYTSYQLGYSSTYFRSQGRTIDRCYVLYSKYINKPLFYVGLTRHVRNAQCFVSHTDARFISDIKHQAKREEIKESSVDYQTLFDIELHEKSKELEENINALKNSSSIFNRLKGGYLTAVNSVKSHVVGYVEKIQDRHDSKSFYNNVYLSNGRKGSVKVVEERLEVKNPKNLHAIDVEKQNLISHIEDKVKVSKKELIEITDKQKNALKSYFDKTDESSSLYSIVRAEASNSNISEKHVPSFEKWQNSCVERNKDAYTVYQSFSKDSLKTILGSKAFEILKDRTDKYERHITPKINVGEKLKENLESLLYTLFPEGPSQKDAKGFRFGAKGSLSVICKGEKIGCYYDFENQRGGGILQLIQDKLTLNEIDAKEWVNNFLNNPQSNHIPSQYSIKQFNKSEEKEWISSIPSKDQSMPSLNKISKYLDENYTLIASHPYYENENIVMYNLRLQSKKDPKNKTILPLSYGSSNLSRDQLKWGLKKFQSETGKNLIYNSHLLKEHPSKPILIVEGEKSADAGNRMFDQFVTISWFGGSGSAGKVDWKLLFGREVIIWADNDTAGYKATDEISKCLRQVGVKSLNVVDYKMLSKEFPEKWDIADPLPQGKDLGFITDCIQRAEQKAVGIDRLSALLETSNKNGKDLFEIRRLNEILSRIDERIRPDLEKEYTSKPWEVENRILTEVSVILKSKEELMKIGANLSGHKNMIESIVFHGMLHQARTGEMPSLNSLEEFKKSIINCNNTVNEHIQINEKIHSYALDKTSVMMIENKLLDKNNVNNYFKECVAEAVRFRVDEALNNKTKDMEISIANI